MGGEVGRWGVGRWNRLVTKLQLGNGGLEAPASCARAAQLQQLMGLVPSSREAGASRWHCQAGA